MIQVTGYTSISTTLGGLVNSATSNKEMVLGVDKSKVISVKPVSFFLNEILITGKEMVTFITNQVVITEAGLDWNSSGGTGSGCEPKFTSFFIQGQSTTLEIGDCVTGGGRNFIWSVDYPNLVDPNSIKIEDVTNSVVLGSGLSDDGSENLNIGANVCNSTPNTTNTWRISGMSTNGNLFSRTFTVVWRALVYWGEEDGTILNDPGPLPGLYSSNLRSGFNGSYSFIGLSATYNYIAYPKSWGPMHTLVNQTNFPVALNPANINTPYKTQSTTNSFSVTTDYYVYKTFNLVGGSDTYKAT